MVLFHLLLLFFCTFPSKTSTRRVALIHNQSHAVAAAIPILQDHPFVVVWNMPTAKCQKRYDIHLDLGDFDIVENRQQHFQGQNMTIFYRNHLGKYPYLSHDGRKVNGGIPQLGDLSGHLSLSVTQMSNLLLPNFTGLAVIDWEEWQPLWKKNTGTKMEYRRLSKQLVRQEAPHLSDKALTLLASQKFEESARMFMEETLQLMGRHRPKGHWGFYGLPECLNENKRETDESYTGRCHRGTKRQNDMLSWLWQQSTALYPSIYLPVQLAGSVDAALMVRHRLLEALRVASMWRHGNNTSQATPVFAYARLAFINTFTFLDKIDLVHSLGESAALGAAGVVLWGQLRFAESKHQCILLRDYIHTVLGPYIRSLKADVRQCSLQLCQGNGRCTRRHPSSGHMVPSGLAEDSSSGKAIYEHFMCQCYPGWTGKECQEKNK